MADFVFADIRATDAGGAPLPTGATGDSVRRSVFDLLGGCTLCSIATVTCDGRPHINTAYFSYSDRPALYFLSHPDSLHCRNISTSPGAAVTVFSTDQRWAESDEGLQLIGTCSVTSGIDEEAARRSYAARFARYTAWHAALAGNELAARFRFYRFDPSAVKILDEKRFGDGVSVHASLQRREVR